MDTAILAFVIVASVVGLLLAVLYPALPLAPGGAPPVEARTALPREERALWRPLFLGAGILALFLFAVSLPSRPPWSAGQGLGVGIVLGTVAALLGAGLLRGTARRIAFAGREPWSPALQLAGMFTAIGLLSLACLTVCAALLFFRAAIFDVLNGVALGALFAVALIRVGLGLGTLAGSRFGDGTAIEGWAVCLATLAVGVAFAMRHFPASLSAVHATPLAVVAVAIVAMALGAGVFGPSASAGRAFWGAGGLTAVVVAALAALALPRLVPVPGAALVLLLGLGTAVLISLLLGASVGSREGAGPGLESGLISGLMLLGVFVVSFQSLQGYGAALAILGAWAVGGVALGVMVWHDLARLAASAHGSDVEAGSERLARVATGLHRFLAVALLPLLFRLFLAGRYRPLATDLPLTIHFTLVGLLIGAMAPLLPAIALERACWRLRSKADPKAGRIPSGAAPPGAAPPPSLRQGPPRVSPSPSTRAALLLWAGIGLWSVVVPAAIGLAWGKGGLTGVLAGLIVAGLYALLLAGSRPAREDAGIVASGALLGSLLMAFVIVQGAHLLDPLAVLHRNTKVGVLAAAGLVGLAWVILSARSALGGRSGGPEAGG